MHKTAPSPPTPTIDPAIVANVRKINQKNSHGKPGTSGTSQPRSVATTSSAAAASVSPPKVNSGLAKAVHSTEMGALFNAVIEKNSQKVNDCIRTSLEKILTDFWDVAKPTQQLQKLQDQMENMRSVYGGKIDELKHENSTLKQELDTMTAKLDAQLAKVQETVRQNDELNNILSETNSKMADMSTDLRESTLK